jgi:oligopeptide transport system substrate-binding protein
MRSAAFFRSFTDAPEKRRMKAFYLVALALVIVMAMVPYVLLQKQDIMGGAGRLNMPAASAATSAPASQSARREPVVVYSSYQAKVRTLDPALCGDEISGAVQGYVFEGLYGYHFLKRPLEIVPTLADGMPRISEDGLTYTIRIKKGVNYCRNECFGRHPDGAPKTRAVEANDFVMAFKRIADPHLTTPSSLAFIEDKIVGIKEYRDTAKGYEKGNFARYDEVPLEGVKAIDEHTLQIKLAVRFPQLIYVLAISNYSPIPREVVDYHLSTRDDGKGGREDIPRAERSPIISDYKGAVGTGAYYFQNYIPGGDILLFRNPDFREDFYPSEGAPGDAEAGLLKDAGKRVPFVDVNVLKYIPEYNTAWSLFFAKQTDICPIPEYLYSQAVTPSAELSDKLARQGIQLIKYTRPSVFWCAFNMEDPVLGKSKSLRQALNLGFNVEEYIEVLFNGRGRRAVNTVPHDMAESNDLPPCPYARYDLAAAKEKMAAARKELEEAGVIKSGQDFPELRLDLGGREEDHRRIGEFTRIQFKKLGLKLRIELDDWPTLQEKVENKQVQIYSMGWGADYPDPESFFQLYYSPNINRGTNNCNFVNAKFDRLYEQSSVMSPGPQRTKLYARMVEILNEECPALLLTEPIYFVLAQPWVHNVKVHPIGYGMFKYCRVDVEECKKAEGL